MTTTPAYDVIVLGVGGTGSAACHALARRGVSVLGLEQYDLLHNRGSSHGDSRMIRLAYFEHPDYVPLLRAAYTAWEALERRSGHRLLFKTGGLYLGSEEGELVPESLRAARQWELPHEELDAAAVRRRFPAFHLPEGYRGMWEPEAGFVLPEATVATQARLALEAGATIRARETVLSWQAEPGGEAVTVRTDQATYHGGRLVITAGPWAGRLLAPVLAQRGVELTPTRQVLGWLWPRDPEPFRYGLSPVWAVEADTRNGDGEDADLPHPGGLYYGFPMLGELGGCPGLKVGHHQPGPPLDPNEPDRTPRTGEEEDFRPWISHHLPKADGLLLGLAACIYTNSPDGHFLVDHHPEHGRAVTFAAGLSGHGFKFVPLLGDLLADLALEGTTELPVGFLGLERFGDV